MDAERLIELVRNSPILYDMSIEEYMDCEAKNKVWKDIATELKTNVALCKARWYNIRNNFHKSLMKNASRQNARFIQQYKYADHLKFVKPFFVKKPVKSVENDTKQELCNDNCKTKDNEGNESPTPHKKMKHSSKCTTEDNERNECPTPRKKMRHSSMKSVPPQTTTATLMEKLMKTPQKEHPVDVFLQSLTLPLKSLTPLKFNAAKTQLFAIVQEFEREMLQSDH